MENQIEVSKEFAEQFKAVFERIYKEAYGHNKNDMDYTDAPFHICKVLEEVFVFSLWQPQSQSIVSTINEIKKQSKGSHIEIDVNRLCDSLLEFYIDFLPHLYAISDIEIALDDINGAVQDFYNQD